MEANKLGLLSGVAPTLPSHYYYSPEVFEQEKERIFYDMWFHVGREADLPEPGAFILREVGDESIIVSRDRSGELHAFYNVCRHRGTRLCTAHDGRFKGNVIVCPYHAWTYGLDGRLLSTPNMLAADNFQRQDHPLFSVALQTWEGFIFVNLSPHSLPLSAQLGDKELMYSRYQMKELKVGHRITYHLEANWKVIVENYLECLHCPHIHPELCEIVPLYRSGLVTEVDGSKGNRITEGGYTLTATGRSNRPLFPGLDDEEKRTYGGGVIFPNLLLNLHPDCVMTHALWPEGPARTTVVCEWLFQPSTMARADFDPRDIVEFWDLVNRQDWEVCELVQKGVRSRAYKQGVYAPQEGHLYSFNQYVLQKLEGA